jgi:hypothetical protein
MDHSMAVAMAWTPGFLYMGLNVVDDFHQNPGGGQVGPTSAFSSCIPTGMHGQLASFGPT